MNARSSVAYVLIKPSGFEGYDEAKIKGTCKSKNFALLHLFVVL
jgi:hypothetical protein